MADATCSAVDALTLSVALEPLPADLVVAGDPRTGVVDLDGMGVGRVAVGVWEHSAGTSTDVEADEVFVVVAGRATVEVQDGPVLELAAGTVCVLRAGARTRWTVHEQLRKVYVLP